MYGIIPVVPHTLHNVYRDLVTKGLAVKVETVADLERLKTFSDQAVAEYRANIFQNSAYFTFEAGAEAILEEWEIFKTRPFPPPGPPDRLAAWAGAARKILRRQKNERTGLVERLPRFKLKSDYYFLWDRWQFPCRPWLDQWWVRLARRVCPRLVDTLLIAASGAFDPEYYFTVYPELLRKRRHPIYGYVRSGASQGRNPNDWFDTKAYLKAHPELIRSDLNPLVHYLYGAKTNDKG